MAPTLFENPPKPGDLIEISRGTYDHWAIYIGGNEVVHLIPPSSDVGGLNSLLMLLDSRGAEVRRQKLSEVVGRGEFRVNNLLDDECEPRDRRVIVRDACRMVGQVLPYCIATHNCEHFVTELRYGKPESRQVKDAAMVATVATAGVAVIGLVALGASLFSSIAENEENRRRRK